MSPLKADAIVQAWQAAANAQNIERLLELSDPNIEIVGPRGSGFGHQLLRDWLARAGLTLETLRMFGRDDKVVVAQQAVWKAMDTSEIRGEAQVASFFQVNEQSVVKFARYDSLEEAFAASGLNQADELFG